MSLTDVIGNISDHGIARENRFEVSGLAIPADYNYLVQNVIIPGIQFQTGSYRNIGHTRSYVYNPDYSDIVISWLDTENQDIFNFYKEWQFDPGKGIYNENTGTIAYKDDYVRDLIIKKKDRRNITVDTYIYNRCFPVNIANIQLSTASAGTPTLLSITLNFD